ncbi:hypothetical protein E3Q12_00332 [Wallemia mellicola]|uniref:Nascent polypeptide-associated complex subunit alpha-like UBA domain-containing protein n=1 Tax=Wallemia mellicola TaxID=1708541 RepID=A0AB74KI09_9BASI|nr:hypothetical protein E3Q12_00332 [Wallemia mellicola]TIC71629.1 hypothetical protein E3Q03_00408 [Wallemia mellicola]
MSANAKGDVISEYVDGGSFSRNKLVNSREHLFGSLDETKPGILPEKFPKPTLSAAELKALNKEDTKTIIDATGYSESTAQSKLNQFKSTKAVISDFIN